MTPPPPHHITGSTSVDMDPPLSSGISSSSISVRFKMPWHEFWRWKSSPREPKHFSLAGLSQLPAPRLPGSDEHSGSSVAPDGNHPPCPWQLAHWNQIVSPQVASFLPLLSLRNIHAFSLLSPLLKSTRVEEEIFAAPAASLPLQPWVSLATDQDFPPLSEAPLWVLVESVLERLDDSGLCLHSLKSGEFSGFNGNSADLSRKRAGAFKASLSSSLVTNLSGHLPLADAVPPSSAQSVEPLLST